jgi:hypothetical protein
LLMTGTGTGRGVAQDVSQTRLSSISTVRKNSVLFGISALQFPGCGVSGGGELVGALIGGELRGRLRSQYRRVVRLPLRLARAVTPVMNRRARAHQGGDNDQHRN